MSIIATDFSSDGDAKVSFQNVNNSSNEAIVTVHAKGDSGGGETIIPESTKPLDDDTLNEITT